MAETRKTFKEEFSTIKTAFLAMPAAVQSPELIAEIRHRFPKVKIRTHRHFTENGKEYRKNLRKYLSECDSLIVCAGDDRRIHGGVYREVMEARALRKFTLIYNLTSKRWERFCGFDKIIVDGKPRGATLRVWKPRSPDEQCTAATPITALSGETPTTSIKTRWLKRLKAPAL